jgi:hypothetical protein
MSTDFKALWNNEGSKVPDIQEIFAKANKLNQSTRRKIWWENIVLGITAIFIAWVWWHYQPKMITTQVGLVMVIGGIVMYIVVTNQMFSLLTDGDAGTDSRKYLAQMIRVKQKQEFIGTTLMGGYYILLSAGLGLYLIEYSARGSLLFKVLFYGLTFGWIIFCWFYFVPKRIKKQRKAMNGIIEKLEEVNRQLGE